VLVGKAVTPEYGESLRALVEALAPGAVAFESGLSDA
jgi:glycosyltransferase involved in cell wall biosynthesis